MLKNINGHSKTCFLMIWDLFRQPLYLLRLTPYNFAHWQSSPLSFRCIFIFLGVLWCTNARGRVRNKKSNPEGVSESRFTRYSHCYITWCPITTGIVASQYPSSRHAVLARRCLTPSILACLNTVKATLPQQNKFTTNLRTWMKVVTLLLTAIICGIFHKQCQWLPVTHAGLR